VLAVAVMLPAVAHAGPHRSTPPIYPSGDIGWSFHAGAPLAAPPSFGPDGSVLVVTMEGYLHALRADGGYRYSYTLRGRAVGSPVATRDGLVIVAVEPNRLIALDSEGALVWATTVVGGIATPPVVDDRSRLWVGTRGRTLLAFSMRGGVSAFARVGAAPLSGPVALTGGEVALAASDGSIYLTGGGKTAVTSASSEAIHGLFPGEDAVYALGEAGLLRFETAPLGERWRRAGVSRVLCTRPDLVVLERGGLRFLTPRGEPGSLVPFPAVPDAPATCLADGSVLVASDARFLLRLDARGTKARRPIPAGDVLSVHAVPSVAALVAYRSGRVVALR
jgi:outer membrane protein assembly factor BamB